MFERRSYNLRVHASSILVPDSTSNQQTPDVTLGGGMVDALAMVVRPELGAEEAVRVRVPVGESDLLTWCKWYHRSLVRTSPGFDSRCQLPTRT